MWNLCGKNWVSPSHCTLVAMFSAQSSQCCWCDSISGALIHTRGVSLLGQVVITQQGQLPRWWPCCLCSAHPGMGTSHPALRANFSPIFWFVSPLRPLERTLENYWKCDADLNFPAWQIFSSGSTLRPQGWQEGTDWKCKLIHCEGSFGANWGGQAKTHVGTPRLQNK